MPRKDGVLREIAEKSTIKAENSLKIRQKRPSPEKLTANVKVLGFQHTSYNGNDPLAVTLSLQSKIQTG
ncbi:MAG: hypothetical protein L7S53_07595 [Luminiphilus sp.]|nr:hypothetical protein [Luminiphilus sp.]